MSIGNFALGAGFTALDKFFTAKAWTLQNLDTGEKMAGQFPAEEPTREVGSNWAPINSLNRQNPVLQYIRGESDTFSIPTQFFKQHMLDESPMKKLETLIRWCRIDSKYRRPPILQLVVGGGFNQSSDGGGAGFQADVVMNGISGITYGQPNKLGGINRVKFQMNFTRHRGFDINETIETDTRYARTRAGDYYEFLAQEEYGDPMLGVVIRALPEHQSRLDLKPGSIVKLPSIEGVRNSKPQPTSVAFKSAFGRKNTPQRKLLMEFFDLRNVARPSALFTPSSRR